MGWTSCKEKNGPDDSCLPCILTVSGKNGNVTYDRAVVGDDFTNFEGGKWYINGVLMPDVVVHAWMPFPDAYEGE